jgi:hypothetical protein
MSEQHISNGSSGRRSSSWNDTSSSSTTEFCSSSAPEFPTGTCLHVQTAKAWLRAWWHSRRGCSPSGTGRMWSFWMASRVPMDSSASDASARQHGNSSE